MESRLMYVLLVFVLFSCNKNKPEYELNGTVKDALTGNGLEAVQVKLLKQEVSNGVVNAFYMEETSGVSNASGEFRLNWPNQQVLSYKLRLEKDHYYAKEIVLNPDELQLNDPNSFSYVMYANSWLNMELFSATFNGSISFSSTGTSEICECESLSPMSFATNELLQLNCGTFGSDYLKYVVYDSFGNVILIDSIYTQPFIGNPLQLSF
jgi:hypothetical protein